MTEISRRQFLRNSAVSAGIAPLALSGLAIFQLKKRGAPVCIGGVPEAMDLSTARVAYGSPETSLYSAAAADIGRWRTWSRRCSSAW